MLKKIVYGVGGAVLAIGVATAAAEMEGFEKRSNYFACEYIRQDDGLEVSTANGGFLPLSFEYKGENHLSLIMKYSKGTNTMEVKLAWSESVMPELFQKLSQCAQGEKTGVSNCVGIPTCGFNFTINQEDSVRVLDYLERQTYPEKIDPFVKKALTHFQKNMGLK